MPAHRALDGPDAERRRHRGRGRIAQHIRRQRRADAERQRGDVGRWQCELDHGQHGFTLKIDAVVGHRIARMPKPLANRAGVLNRWRSRHGSFPFGLNSNTRTKEW